jgi:poly-gamma-glutamate capsule biosynthesis protein CapA/YwtB (metallophosphatase superfamily)
MINEDGNLVFYAVGDIAPNREEPRSIFQHVTGLLKRGDIVFCQLEANLSNRGTLLPQARLASRTKPETAQAIKEAGFNIVSFASNHCMDLGPEAFYDTIAALKKQGLWVIGVGSNIEEARKPAIIECKGTRIAFLAYNSILPYGFWADIDKPGCTPLRAWTFYEQVEHDQPGTPCRIHTFPHKEDLQAMVDDIRQAKSQADFVILSLHWGIHFIPAVIADYQREVAHVAIDSGADLILGTHAHILKAIEVYAGKVIFYSLCNFALDLSANKRMLESKRHKEIQKLNPDWQPDPDYPTYYMPRDSRKTIIVKCMISDGEIKRVSFLPTYINGQSQPEVLTSKNDHFHEVVKYMQEITRDQGIDTDYTIEGDEVIIHK